LNAPRQNPYGLQVDTLGVVLTTVGGALSATLGVIVGGLVTRRVQERHWLRDRQLRSYEELFAQYARFMMILRRAHAGRTPADVDWAAWSVALTTASLVAPAEVARAIDGFGRAIQLFLDALRDRDPVRDPLDIDEVGKAAAPAGVAHLALLNTIRRSLGRSLGELPFFLGGTMTTEEDKQRWLAGAPAPRSPQ
jgi:hypothetical protein